MNLLQECDYCGYILDMDDYFRDEYDNLFCGVDCFRKKLREYEDVAINSAYEMTVDK